MAVMNNKWGICGVTSSLYALYKYSAKQQKKKMAKGALTPTMMLAEMKLFLRTLQADGRQDLIGDIESFTQSFGGEYEHFTVNDYINRINYAAVMVDAVSAPGSKKEKAAQEAVADRDFSIALPPEAVVYYLRNVCGFGQARVVDVGAKDRELLVGLYRDEGNNMGIYGGLKHYVYYYNGGPVLIEARVKNRDIGFIRAGQAVEVKVETFPFTRYGLLTGTVRDVSRDAVPASAKQARQDGKDGQQVEDGDAPEADPSDYVVHVALVQTAMVVDGRTQPITPGMAVTAEIKIGRRRFTSYLVSH
ncbi:putative HlyD family type I secretion protein [Acidisphaera rubrifaciens]|nr:HlyD family secretion protein [Acidisphaera rubrifaciens]